MEHRPSTGRLPGGQDDHSFVSVYIAESHVRVLEVLVEHVNAARDLRVVGSCTSLVEGVEQIIRLQPRVVVVDAQLGGGTGLDVCRRLRWAAPDVSCVIVTTAVASMWEMHEAAQAGAAGYVVKRLRDFDLNDVIVRVADGERPIDANLVAHVDPVDHVVR